MKNITQKIEAVRHEVGNILHHHRCAFVNVRALQQVRNERLAQMKFALQQHAAPEIFSISNSLARPFAFVRSEEAHIHASIQATLTVWENAEEFLEAESIIQPLLDQLAVLEAEQAAANLAAGEAESKRRNAMDEAKAQAISAIEREFALPEPQPEQEPEKPFRGRGLKPALVTV